MIAPGEHFEESERLKDLHSYAILDSLPESDYDNLTAIASQICGTPISLVSLIDDKRQWFKSHHGLSVSETPKEYAFCAHAINDQNNIMIVEDARKDKRFQDNPLVLEDPHVIFYVGVPLISEDGFPLGTLCVIDNQPKVLTQSQIVSLSALASQVMSLLSLRKNRMLLTQSLLELENKHKELEQFAYIASHDLQEPLNTITSYIDFLEESPEYSLQEVVKQSFRYMRSASTRMKELVTGLLEYNRLGKSSNAKKVDCNRLVSDIVKNLDSQMTSTNAKIEVAPLPTIKAFEMELELLFENLIQNAIKFKKPDVPPEVVITAEKKDTKWKFVVKDNGIGIAPKYKEKIFLIFQRLHRKDEYPGTGIGLAFCRKIVEIHNGAIWVDAEVDLGSAFQFTIDENIKSDDKT